MDEIIKHLKRGEVVALPTDTVYGLAAPFAAVDKLFALKGRSPHQPILILAATLDQIEPYLENPPQSFYWLARDYWPGPLSLVVPVKGDLPQACQQEGSAGFRIPNHPLALEVLAEVGPLAVTSANRSGEPPAKKAEEVHFDVPILAGGAASGEPSTILKWEGARWELIRMGKVVPLLPQ
ncbi:MAG: L-threonylcarbamoyladenylate synthase [Parachlamydiales bacterium]